MEKEPGLARCDELWFPDGTVVLRAKNVLFRTYIGALAGASAVFRDMFALPQPTVAEGQEVYEGLPFVRLVDTAFDVTQLLRSLHCGNRDRAAAQMGVGARRQGSALNSVDRTGQPRRKKGCRTY
jgi:hypothetical protein